MVRLGVRKGGWARCQVLRQGCELRSRAGRAVVRSQLKWGGSVE